MGSNVTPCVFQFKVGLSIPKKNESKKVSGPGTAQPNSWSCQSNPTNGWNQTITVKDWNKREAQTNSWNRKPLEITSQNIWNTDKVNAGDLLSLSEKKQKNLSDYCLHKKAVIREIKKKEDVWRGS